MQLTLRDRKIIQLVYRHRFIRSNHIITLLGGSSQQISRRLKLLYQHGYLERPRAQLEYYERGGSRPIVYGLSNKGGRVLREEFGNGVSWNETDGSAGQMFLAHAVLVSDVMTAIELACRKHSGIQLIYEDDLFESKPSHWQVKLKDGTKLGVVPDRVFALAFTDRNGTAQKVHYFLEADRGTMPVIRKGLAQSSFYRKLLAYEATWTQKIHQRKLGIHRFQVLTVTTNAARVKSLVDACSRLDRGHGLFLFADRTALEKDLFSPIWQRGKSISMSGLLDLPSSASLPPS